MFWIPIGIGFMLGSEKGRKKLLGVGRGIAVFLKDSVEAIVEFDSKNQKIIEENKKEKEK